MRGQRTLRGSGHRVVRAAAWIAPDDVRREFVREWEAELTWKADRLARRGGSRGAARSQLIGRACGAFAHAAWLRMDRWRIEMLVQDLTYAIRTLVRRPGFAILAVLTLALGIGANAAMFSAVRAVLLRPLPFPDAANLMQISSTQVANPSVPGGSVSPPDFHDWRQQSASFQEMAAISVGSVPFIGHGAAEQIPSAMVTGGFFDVLGVPALFGRALSVEDDGPAGPATVVMAHTLWIRRFGGNPGVIGETMVLDGTPRRIVGVMPPGFAYPLGSELWLPLRFTANELATQRGAQYLDVIARLETGVTRDAAQAEMAQIVARLAAAYPSHNRNKAVALFGLREALVGSVRPALLALVGAVGFVLLIVCVNLASLTLTRAIGRTRELAVRVALGAGRLRLVNGLLVESAVVALAGGLAGLGVAYWVARGIASLDTGLGIPLLDQTRIDGVVLAFTAAITCATAVLSGTLPAWHASGRLDVVGRIREDSASVAGGRERRRLRGGLIIAETALAVVLLVGAGLLMRSFLGLVNVDLGFEPRGVQTFGVSLPAASYATPDARAQFIDRLVMEVGAHPQVAEAGAVFGLPLTNFGYGISMSTLDGRALDDDEQMARTLQVRVVTPRYFHAMGIALVRGRGFVAEDRRGSAPVVIVNQTAANRLWPDADPIGHAFTLGTRMGQGGERAGGTVVGVAADVRDHGPTRPVRPTVYLAHAQFPVDTVTIVARTAGDPATLIEPSRKVLSDLDPNLPMFRVRSMAQLASNAVAQPRLYLLLLGLFAGTAVLLAAIGIYGVLMHAVSERRREIGLRLALGADRTQVMSLVVRQAAVLALTGLTLGLLIAAGASRVIRGLLYGVEPMDVTTYAWVAAGLLAVAVVASVIPARRAAHIDPAVTLRL